MKTAITILAALSLAACSTVTAPDGTKTVKPDNRAVVSITDLVRDLFAPVPVATPAPSVEAQPIVRKAK